MKRCPRCNRSYTDPSLNFCLEDGTPLVASGAPDPNATIRYTGPLDTAPSTPEVQRQPAPLLNQVDATAQPRQWSPMPPAVPRKKSSAVWWIVGGLLVVGIIGVGAVIMIIALASLGSNANRTNTNTNSRNVNTRVVTRNTNVNASNSNNSNVDANLPSEITDDFSDPKWGTGNFKFGDIWYDNDEYHLRSKASTYLVMYAPTNDYNTANATVRLTGRSVNGTPPSSGFGLIVHGKKSESGALEDYALLIYTGAEPKYEIIKHKNGQQTAIIPWTVSRTIRTGTDSNQLEVRVRGTELTFYINGQYVDRISDTENFKRGVAGVYTSDTAEVAFDDLEITR